MPKNHYFTLTATFAINANHIPDNKTKRKLEYEIHNILEDEAFNYHETNIFLSKITGLTLTE